LTVIHVDLPPLRRRRRDAAVLMERFLGDRSLPAGGRELLDGLRWPGNVRELRNVARRLQLRVGDGVVLAEDLAGCLMGESGGRGDCLTNLAVGKVERVASLLVSEPTVSAAWRKSGLSRTTFYRYVRLAREALQEAGGLEQQYGIA